MLVGGEGEGEGREGGREGVVKYVDWGRGGTYPSSSSLSCRSNTLTSISLKRSWFRMSLSGFRCRCFRLS